MKNEYQAGEVDVSRRVTGQEGGAEGRRMKHLARRKTPEREGSDSEEEAVKQRRWN